ncbi:MAG: hypothetical protein SLRJCFUN_000830 [Candidatus Fervidibacter sp.]
MPTGVRKTDCGTATSRDKKESTQRLGGEALKNDPLGRRGFAEPEHIGKSGDGQLGRSTRQ